MIETIFLIFLNTKYGSASQDAQESPTSASRTCCCTGRVEPDETADKDAEYKTKEMVKVVPPKQKCHIGKVIKYLDNASFIVNITVSLSMCIYCLVVINEKNKSTEKV